MLFISSTDSTFYLSFFHSWFCPCIRLFKKLPEFSRAHIRIRPFIQVTFCLCIRRSQSLNWLFIPVQFIFHVSYYDTIISIYKVLLKYILWIT